MEESKMQWKTTSRFHGVAASWWNSSLLCSLLFFRCPPLRERKNAKVRLWQHYAKYNYLLHVKMHAKELRFVVLFVHILSIINMKTSAIFFRYGPIFRTSLVGRPVIVSTDSDLNYFIFQQEGQLFQSWYPDTFTEIFGRQNIGSLHGFMYKYLKNMMLNLFGPEALKKMIPEVEQVAKRNLRKWSSQITTEMKEATASVSRN